MTRPVLTVAADDGAGDVAGAMHKKGIKSIAVIDGACHPIGILTSTDYLEMVATEVDPHTATMGDFMTTDIVSVSLDTDIETAAARMHENEINHLPVVDDDRQAVGIVSTTDLTGYLADDT